jgi:hypothetical protein
LNQNKREFHTSFGSRAFCGAVPGACVPDVKQAVGRQGVLYDEVNKWPIERGKRSCRGSAFHLTGDCQDSINNQAVKIANTG